MGDHEWCFYGWREGAAHIFLGPNNVPDVWPVKKVNPNKMVHLTEKPVELAARAMQYSSRVGENVLDLFGGSGSTLIAAEQTGRKAFLMELDPLYCDVIVERFAAGKLDPLDFPGVLVNRHAPFTWGASVAKAVEVAVAVECIAHMALMSLQLEPKLATIERELLEKHFKRKHGAGAYYGQTRA